MLPVPRCLKPTSLEVATKSKLGTRASARVGWAPVSGLLSEAFLQAPSFSQSLYSSVCSSMSTYFLKILILIYRLTLINSLQVLQVCHCHR